MRPRLYHAGIEPHEDTRNPASRASGIPAVFDGERRLRTAKRRFAEKAGGNR